MPLRRGTHWLNGRGEGRTLSLRKKPAIGATAEKDFSYGGEGSPNVKRGVHYLQVKHLVLDTVNGRGETALPTWSLGRGRGEGLGLLRENACHSGERRGHYGAGG